MYCIFIYLTPSCNLTLSKGANKIWEKYVVRSNHDLIKFRVGWLRSNFCQGEEEGGRLIYPVKPWTSHSRKQLEKVDISERAGCELVPLADDLHCVFLSSLLVCAASANGEAALSQNAVPQVHLITHIERWVLHEGTINQNMLFGQI